MTREPALMTPHTSAENPGPQGLPGKDPGLTLLGHEPLVAETPEGLLDEETTPIARFFVRNNGLFPASAGDPESWTLTIDGEVERELRITLPELKAAFPHRILHLVLECGGNGRSFFRPLPKGNAWTHGGVGCAAWTGVSLGDVLRAAGLTPRARYTGHFGADPDAEGRMDRQAMSRGVPIAKALEEHTLLVWGMNGEALPFSHGGPLRLVVPGWPGSLSQKWLNRIWIRDREHDGPGMTGTSYRLPDRPIAPGSSGEGVPFRIIESMPVRSIVTRPADSARYPAGTRVVTVRGAAWAGDSGVAAVELSVDGGKTWTPTRCDPPRNRYDWTRWTAELGLPSDGSFEILARATDAEGRRQPLEPENWNPGGYACNAVHRVGITIG